MLKIAKSLEKEIYMQNEKVARKNDDANLKGFAGRLSGKYVCN